MKLSEGIKAVKYIIKKVSGDNELNTFLYSLGCIENEAIQIVKIMRSTLIINIKGSRFAIDKSLANVIEVI
ncbi:MAG TPA: FeoA domain-containing protein [Haloplasmataceae bacterium]